MATTEHARHRLYQRLNELIGSDEADTLMELLPPTGWADVATKQDLAHHAEATNARIDALGTRIDALGTHLGALDARTDSRFDRLEDMVRTQAQTFEARMATNAQLFEARMDTNAQTFEARMDTNAQLFEALLGTEIAGVRIELADLRSELHQSLRVHTLVTVGVLGTLISVVGMLTGGG